MEDRKRPAISSADEIAPPSKRVAVNGSKAKDDPLDMKEESWVEVSHTTTSSITSARVSNHPISLYALLFEHFPPSLSGFMPFLLGWSWTAVLTKPVMMLACSVRQQ